MAEPDATHFAEDEPPAPEAASPPEAEDVRSLQKRLAAEAVVGQKYGTFYGVFTPTLLTILGVIMFLRIGWVVGNAGLFGAWAIMLLACTITLCTGLAMSSITTNIRIGAGGAFSIIAQSLGLEVGGSVGIPLYLSQSLAVTMYIFGFREGWLWIFPGHSAILVDITVFVAVFVIASLSAGLAFRVQFLIMAVIAGSLLSILAAALQGSMQYAPVAWGEFPGSPENNFSGAGFWTVFAVFFPAVTGIMAGANMSGELKNPRRSIPVGTLSAIAVSTVVYFVLAYWLARSATPDELVRNYTILIDRSAWRPIVIGGLLGATFSSALASLVGAPRILYALGEHRIVPLGPWLAARAGDGEPRNATLVTGAIVLAPLISLFFLITYGMINVVVLIEQNLGLVSFRPTMRIPRIVPLAGAVGCMFAMFIQNPAFSLLAIMFVVTIYWFLLRSKLQAPFGDVRSGLFVAVAEWAAKQVSHLPAARERTWQPNLLVPVETPRELRGSFRLLYSIARPKGTIKILGLTKLGEQERLRSRLPVLTDVFRKQGVFASYALMDSSDFGAGVTGGMQALRGAILRPNLVFLTMPKDAAREADLRSIIGRARGNGVGVVLFAMHQAAGLGLEKSINLWIHERSPGWEMRMEMGNLDTCVLLAYLLQRNWDAKLTLITIAPAEADVTAARDFLRRLVELTRLPARSELYVDTGNFRDRLASAPEADLQIFGMPGELHFDEAQRFVDEARSSCMFLLASGEESAMA
jgi:solute carrier family 12 (sodium/potassium/chloride transporter), member 2